MVHSLRPGRLAIGTAPLGGLYAAVTEADALATLDAARAGGITHFDTAPHYGRGLSEERLGAFLSGAGGSDGLTVSTKVGRRVRPLSARADDDIFLGAPPGESVFDFSVRGIREELDESRSRLGREFIDVVFVHDPDDHLEESLGAFEELTQQRDAGRIGAVGVGTNTASVVHHLLDRVGLDVVLLAGRITLLESSGETVARRCADEDVTLFAAGVFQSGILAAAGGEQDSRTATYDYLPASDAIRARVAELREVCEAHGTTLHRVAINHPRRFEGVASTLIGVRSPAEVDEAIDAINTDVPTGLWAAIDEVRARQHDEIQGDQP